MTANDDAKRGLYGKYKVERVDGSSGTGGKHERCYYYVLDLDHDKHAKAAILAYADSCEAEYPKLAKDLRRLTKPSRTVDSFFGRRREYRPSFGKD